MRINYKFLSVVLSMCLLFAGCTSDEPLSENQEGSGTESNVPDDQYPSGSLIPHNIVKTYDFDLNFFKSAIENYDGNIVVSPLGAHMAFGIVAAGSSSAKASDIVSALKCVRLEFLQAFHSEVVNTFPSLDSKVISEYSSSLWHVAELNVSSDFSDIFLDTYGGRLFPCDMNSSDTSEAIATWCSEHTKKTVSGVSVSDDADLLLLSSIYFKSPWSSSLRKDELGSPVGVFYGDSGEKECDLVKLMGNMFYTSASDGSYDAVKVDLGNGSYRVTFVVPGSDVDASEVLENINYRYLINQDATDLNGKSVWKLRLTNLSLPVFGASASTYDLSNIFDKMGFGEVVSEAFDRIDNLQEGANIQLTQTAAIEFSDDGVENASVSQGIRPTDYINFSDDYSGKPMVIDRPYLFFIHETTTGACILAGRITDI